MSHVPVSVSVTVISMSSTPFDKYAPKFEYADVLFGGYTYSSSVYPAGSRDGFFSSKTSSLPRYAFFIFDDCLNERLGLLRILLLNRRLHPRNHHPEKSAKLLICLSHIESPF